MINISARTEGLGGTMLSVTGGNLIMMKEKNLLPCLIIQNNLCNLFFKNNQEIIKYLYENNAHF